MEKKFFINEDAWYKKILVTEDAIYLSHNLLSNEKFIEEFEQENSAYKLKIYFETIYKFSHIPKSKEVEIEYKRITEDEGEDENLEFVHEKDSQDFTNCLAQRMNLKGERGKVGHKNWLMTGGIAVVLSAITYALLLEARMIENGEEIVIEGRRKAMKRMIVWVLDLIGVTGVWIIGGILVGLCLLATYHYFKIRNYEQEVFKK